MMAKIVHHRHPAGDAAHFHAALDAFESVEGALNLFVGQAAMLGAGDHRQALRTLISPTRLRWNLKLGISNSLAVGP
jgi:hypothetical protein